MTAPTLQTTEPSAVRMSNATQLAQPTGQRSGASIRHDLLACALITLLWIVPAFIVGLHGEFPLNDDWAYAKSVQKYIETGNMSRKAWTHIPIVTHTFIGSAFVELFGDSPTFFQSLRMSGHFMGWVGIMGAYMLCRQVGAGLKWSTFAALLYGFNPIYFNLSYTYMTDVPFSALFVWSVALVTRGFATGKWWWFAAGVVFAILATLTRQFGLALPIGFAAALVVTRPTRWWRWILAVALPLIVLFAYFAVTRFVYGDSQAITGNAYLVHHVVVKRWNHLFFILLKEGTHHWLHLGLFLAPFAWLLAHASGARRLWIISITLALTVVGTAVMYWKEWHLPRHNIIYNLGVGAKETIPGFTTLPQAPTPIWWIISIGCVLSTSFLGLLILDYVVRCWPASRRNQIVTLLIGTGAAYLAIIVYGNFDRYILPILPLAMALLAYPYVALRASRRRGIGGAIAVVLVFATFSIAGTRDYLERHRNLWTLLTTMMNKDEIGPERIHGGFEFNRWHGFTKYNHVFSEEQGEFLWVFNDKDEYVASYAAEIDGYTLTDRQITYRRLLPPGTEQISVFQRRPADAARVDSTSDATP